MVHNLLMTAPGFVCTLEGPDHVYQLVNKQYQQLVGKRKIVGKPVMEALPELEGQGFVTILDRVYETGEPYVGIDIPITLGRDTDKVPEVGYFNFSYQPMYDDNKKVNGILVFGYEVTEQALVKNKILELQEGYAKELEADVAQRTQELIAANNSLEEKNLELARMNHDLESFTYISSHDLQEPLRKIQIFINRLIEVEEVTLSDQGKDFFKRIQTSASRMQKLIDDLLAYSHTTTKDRTLETTDLNTILDEVKTELKDAIEHKEAIIINERLCSARITPFQFRQLMVNLISNALKFSLPGRAPVITISSVTDFGKNLEPVDAIKQWGFKLSPETKYCHTTVADNGIGFEPEYKDKIFGVFQRLHGRHEYTGTGIGLAIVKKIVENHHGFITALGEVNKGARFDIYIPTAT